VALQAIDHTVDIGLADLQVWRRRPEALGMEATIGPTSLADTHHLARLFGA